jgi:hypothetical protein
LYLSRAFVRSFRGELRHDPSVAGCSFVIDLTIAGGRDVGYNQGKNAAHTTIVAR